MQCREALSRLPTLQIGELRQQWRGLYKTQAPANLSRELLLRAVAYRMQEVTLGGLRPERQRRLRQIAQQFKQTGAATIRPRPELKPGTRYDDGGFSGGTMERPALQRLIADIRAGRIDIVVVYKVDRLTRSLADFARLVELFDTQAVSFVSVTQQFNTTSSMGRLTLNVLLSFAQFEREVTGERIRDKIAASKKKGLWMGGFVPSGYRAKDRTLVIDPKEADIIRMIFRRYLELGSVHKLEIELAQREQRTRAFVAHGSSSVWGDRPYSPGHLYYLLSNPIYAGKIRHKDKLYGGQHEAIIDRKTFA